MHGFYFSFNQYLKGKFGVRVHRLSLDGGFSCPNIDGQLSKKGCIFCNNAAFSFFTRKKQLPLEAQIIQAQEYARRRFNAEKFIAYFQSFTSTYGDKEFLLTRYSVIRKFPDIVGLAVSTRPDCIDEEKLDIIESFTDAYEVFIEYGLQSVHDTTLKRINRNHTFDDFCRAVDMTVKRDNPHLHVAVHIILGLPGESKEDMYHTAEVLSTMNLWGVKFHCLHVVKNTPLEEMYNRGELYLLREDEYIDILIGFMERIPSGWVILRLVSDAQRSLLVAPQWVNDKIHILKRIDEEFLRRNTYQGRLYESISHKS